MKKNCFYVFLVLLSILVFVTPARAQAVEELELSVSRDFGSSDGTGNIQGTFSMKVTGPSNLVKVHFSEVQTRDGTIERSLEGE